MIYEEAIKQFRDNCLQCSSGTTQLACGGCPVPYAVEAMKKQIPKKPFYTDEYCDFAYCPNCEKGEFEFDTNTWEMKYCYECGQAIDWSQDVRNN